MLTLAEVLELPVVRRALPDVIVGADAVERELRWAHVIEMADPSDLLKGGELVLTTGIGAGTQERDQTRWIASLVDQRPAAVMVEPSLPPSSSSCARATNWSSPAWTGWAVTLVTC